MPGSSHAGSPACGSAARARFNAAVVKRGRRGIGDQGRDMSHGDAERDKSRQRRGAYCRADRERQVGAGAGAGRAARRRRSSMPIPCRSIAICASSPRVRAADEERAAPHLLYGHVDAAENYSVGRWCADAAAALGGRRSDGRLPILVGGTGLYFKALTQGLRRCRRRRRRSASAVRARLESEGAAGAACRTCAARSGDPRRGSCRRDRMRIGRALEVLEATGRSLSDWHRDGMPPVARSGRAR